MLTNCKISIAKSAGFCFGVDRAIKIVYNNLDKHDRLVTLGPIIHNPDVVADLERKGIFSVNDYKKINSDKTVVIRSHGVSQSVYDYLVGNGNNIIA